MILHVTYATEHGPITTVYDTDLPDTWTVPQGAVRITLIMGPEAYAPAKGASPPKSPKADYGVSFGAWNRP